MYNTEITHKHQ